MFARSAREVALYEVVRFDFVLTLSDAPAGAPSAPAPPPILSAKGGQAFSSISRGFLKIEWAAGRVAYVHIPFWDYAIMGCTIKPV